MAVHALVNNRTHIQTQVCVIPKPCPCNYAMLPSWEEANRKSCFNSVLRTLMLPLPPTPANECQRQGLDKDLLKGLSSCSTTLPSGPFLKGAFSWSSGWHCTHSVFFLDRVATLPNAVPPSLARELTLLCGPGFGVFLICSVAWSLPARDDTWRTKLPMECPLQWPVRKCHWI